MIYKVVSNLLVYASYSVIHVWEDDFKWDLK